MKRKSSTNKEEWRDDSPIGLRRFGEEFITVGKDARGFCNSSEFAATDVQGGRFKP